MSISLKNKFKITNKDYDVTIVEIKPEIDKIKDFLEFDENILNEPKQYVRNSIYVLHYPIEFVKDKVAVSYGIIKEINKEVKYDFNHYCSTTKGSSGSPILNLSNNKIIGIHKYSSDEQFNIGTFLYYPLKEFFDKYKNKNKRNKFINLIDGFSEQFKDSFLKLFDRGYISDIIPIKDKYKLFRKNYDMGFFYKIDDNINGETIALKLICSRKNIPKNWISAWHGTKPEFIESIIENG